MCGKIVGCPFPITTVNGIRTIDWHRGGASRSATGRGIEKVMDILEKDPKEVPKYSWEQGKSFYKGKLVISKNCPCMSALLQTFHNSVLGGHSKYVRTYKRMARELFRKGMKEDLKICDPMCSLSKKQDRSSISNPCPFQRVWDDIIMNFVERLPKSKGYQSVIWICLSYNSLRKEYWESKGIVASTWWMAH